MASAAAPLGSDDGDELQQVSRVTSLTTSLGLADENGDFSGKAVGAVSTLLILGRKTLMATLSGVSVASSAYFLRRSRFAQVRTMKYKLSKWRTQKELSDESRAITGRRRRLKVKVNREAELRVLEHHFRDAKPSISFVTGPEGSGKSWVCSQAMRSIDFALRVDLHKEQVSGGTLGATELLEHIVRRSGYFYPTNVLADLGLVSQTRDAKGALQRKEVELALYYLEQALEEIVEETQQFPAIYIDELHSLKETALKSNDFTRFLQWAMHVTDKGLCNIVFVGRDTSLYLLDQEHQPLRERRLHFPLDYPLVRPEAVKVVLRQADEGKLFDGAEEAKLLCSAFGGQLRDMEKAIDFADSGLSIKATVDRMVTETAHFVQSMALEPILSEISEATSGTPDRVRLAEAYKRYLRCWNMLSLFGEESGATSKILYDRLLYEVFEENGHEIEEYVAKGLLRYCWPPLGSDKSHEITLTPLSPRFQAAFTQLVHKPGLNKVALDIKRELAKLDLATSQATFSERVNLLLSIQRVLGSAGPDAMQLKDDMNVLYRKLREGWADYDTLIEER